MGNSLVCLAVASTVILGSKSQGPYDLILMPGSSGSLQTIPSLNDCWAPTLLPALTRAVILGSESHGTRNHILWPDSSRSLQTTLSLQPTEEASQQLTSLKSKSKLCYNLQSVTQSVLVSSTDLEPKTNFYYCHTITGLLMWTAVSDERRGLSSTIAAGPCQHSHSQVRVPQNS
jgi:hypothetical protein